MFLLTACGKQEDITETTEVINTQEDPVEEVTEQEESIVCYNVTIGEKSIAFKATQDLAPALVTSDVGLYRSCENPVVFWYDNTEIFVVDTITPPAANYKTVKSLTIATRDTSFDLSALTDLIVDDSAGVISYVDVEPVILEPSAEDEEWFIVFPDFNSVDVYSYARGELADGTKFVVQQKSTDEGIDYVFLGLEDYTCDISMSSQLIIQETGEVIEIEFIPNPNYN